MVEVKVIGRGHRSTSNVWCIVFCNGNSACQGQQKAINLKFGEKLEKDDHLIPVRETFLCVSNQGVLGG